MIAFYFDVNLPAALLNAARQRGLDVVSSQEDGTRTLGDRELLNRATSLNRVLVTQDNDFKQIVTNMLKEGAQFTGVIFVRPGAELYTLAEHLELVAKVETAETFKLGVYYLPL